MFSNNNFNLNSCSFSFRVHQISPSHTCLQRASLHSTSSRYLNNSNLNFNISRNDKHFRLHQLRLLLECSHQDLTSMTSIPSTTCTAAEEDPGQPPGIGGHRHHFDINQLNREHLREVDGQSSGTPVLLRRLHLETSQTTYLFNHITLSFLFLQPPTNPFTSTGTKTSCSSATTSASQFGFTYATSKPRCWDFTTSLTAASSCTSTARTIPQLNVKERANLFTIIAAISSSTLWLSTSIIEYITIGFSTFNNMVSTTSSTSFSTAMNLNILQKKHNQHNLYVLPFYHHNKNKIHIH